jgi:hypothetical protein
LKGPNLVAVYQNEGREIAIVSFLLGDQDYFTDFFVTVKFGRTCDVESVGLEVNDPFTGTKPLTRDTR